MFNIVLVEPEIPNNTGNIGRTCVGTGASLHLIEPLGFEINDRQLKRAGLDYWPHLDWHMHKCFDDWQQTYLRPERVFYFSTKAKKNLYDVQFEPGDSFVFGKETKGLDERLWLGNDAQALTIPMWGKIRSLNLANSVAVVLYEASRQTRKR